MRHIKPYRLYESRSINLSDFCDRLLSGFPIWEETKQLINRDIELVIDDSSERLADAHFDIPGSTKNRVVINMKDYSGDALDKSTLAHELVHSLQWLTNRLGDLMFITDATRQLDEFSDSETWKSLMLAIYISCPQETEAWQAGNRYHHEEILDYILPWMKEFSPEVVSEELESITPDENAWGMETFSEFPSNWCEAYEEYDEVAPDSDIPGLKEKSLLDFLRHYDVKFKKAYEVLSR